MRRSRGLSLGGCRARPVGREIARTLAGRVRDRGLADAARELLLRARRAVLAGAITLVVLILGPIAATGHALDSFEAVIAASVAVAVVAFRGARAELDRGGVSRPRKTAAHRHEEKPLKRR